MTLCYSKSKKRERERDESRAFFFFCLTRTTQRADRTLRKVSSERLFDPERMQRRDFARLQQLRAESCVPSLAVFPAHCDEATDVVRSGSFERSLQPREYCEVCHDSCNKSFLMRCSNDNIHNAWDEEDYEQCPNNCHSYCHGTATGLSTNYFCHSCAEKERDFCYVFSKLHMQFKTKKYQRESFSRRRRD
jgi:hypothetical protein